ncbi:MAG: hypothetical protein FH761_17935 [Firmicutes bacterium]|nr:hypothetical protein [Bacillota bacterium]
MYNENILALHGDVGGKSLGRDLTRYTSSVNEFARKSSSLSETSEYVTAFSFPAKTLMVTFHDYYFDDRRNLSNVYCSSKVYQESTSSSNSRAEASILLQDDEGNKIVINEVSYGATEMAETETSYLINFAVAKYEGGHIITKMYTSENDGDIRISTTIDTSDFDLENNAMLRVRAWKYDAGEATASIDGTLYYITQ